MHTMVFHYLAMDFQVRRKSLIQSKTAWINLAVLIYVCLGLISERIHIFTDHETLVLAAAVNLWLRIKTDSEIDGVY